MMDLSRRSILTGAIASIFMPSIVRADSLMKLTGVPMDPWVLSYEFCLRVNEAGLIRKRRAESAFNFTFQADGSFSRNTLSYLKKVEDGDCPLGCFPVPDFGYKIVRLSECDVPYHHIKPLPELGDIHV